MKLRILLTAALAINLSACSGLSPSTRAAADRIAGHALTSLEASVTARIDAALKVPAKPAK